MACLLSNFIQSEVSIHTTCNDLIWCKTGLNVVSNTRNVAFELILQQCCTTSCTVWLPILP